MKKVNTVKAHREFDRIIRHGRAIKSPHFSVYFVPSDLEHARIGVSVGKRNGMAVRRVLIKRQVRSIVDEADVLPVRLDLIIVVRPNYDPREFRGLREELLSSLSQMKETIH